MVVPILFIVGVLGRGTGVPIVALVAAFAQALAIVVLIMVAGRYVVRPLLRSAARTGSRDLIMAITLLIVISIAAVTGATGLSAALGAFLAGLLLSESEYRHHIEVDLEPFKDLLLGIFFITVGASIDISVVAAQAGWILLAVAGLVLLKSAILFGVARAFGVAHAVAAELALLLAQASEFAFVVIGLARAHDLLSSPIATSALAVVGLSMLATPLLAELARPIAQRLKNLDHQEQALDVDGAEFEHHVVIGGFGRVGQTIARLLQAENIPFVALDANATVVAEHRRHGLHVYFGDASRRELLERAGVRHARACIVTLDAPGAAERMVAAVRELNPELPAFARAKDPVHAANLVARGAVEVIPEAVEASLQLGARVLEELGVPEEAVAQRLEQARDEEVGRLERRSD
jgi:CPA2 family monovalent cation:H+ antiporter-2